MATTHYQPDFDTRWKELIKALHKYVIQKFFPSLYGQVDWAKGAKYLDKELAKIFADWIKQGKKLGDLLFEYQLKNGEKQLVLIHIEVQHGYDPHLPRRMFTSYYRIRDRHPDTPLTALAIYTGPRIPKNAGTYREAFEGVEVIYNFNYIVLKDLKATELLLSSNPIDLALLAGLHILKIKDYRKRTFRFKYKLWKLCLKNEFDEQTIRNLLIFVYYTIALPKKEEQELEKEIIKTLKMESTPLIEVDRSKTLFLTQVFFGKTYEELIEEWKEKATKEGLEKGKKEGLEKGKKEGLEKGLEKGLEMAKRIEEERTKNLILQSFFRLNLSTDGISKALDVDLEYIEKIIAEAKKGGQKKTYGSNGTSKKG